MLLKKKAFSLKISIHLSKCFTMVFWSKCVIIFIKYFNYQMLTCKRRVKVEGTTYSPICRHCFKKLLTINLLTLPFTILQQMSVVSFWKKKIKGHIFGTLFKWMLSIFLPVNLNRSKQGVCVKVSSKYFKEKFIDTFCFSMNHWIKHHDETFLGVPKKTKQVRIDLCWISIFKKVFKFVHGMLFIFHSQFFHVRVDQDINIRSWFHFNSFF